MMNKRLKKKQLTKQPSKKERIKYWSKAYRSSSIEFWNLEQQYDHLLGNAIKLAFSERKLQVDSESLAEEIKALKQQLEVTQDKLKRTELHNVALKQELEESRKPWLKKAFGRG